MDAVEERVCCQSLEEVRSKLDEVDNGLPVPRCITMHPGFAVVCLDVWVLQTAWFQYVREYRRRAFRGPLSDKYRHIAYRQLARWCWGFLGQYVRVILPSCAVCRIRQTFPTASIHGYTGFRAPVLPN